jgi:chemotaxis protein methyltransferase CheR
MDLLSSQNSISEREFILFKDYFAKNSGIVIPFEKAYLIETRLSKLMLDAGTESFEEFYHYIVSGHDPSMSQKVINAITTNETLWFRDTSPWKVLEERLLPELVEELAYGKKINVRIWCAAASTGQEAYSTVMCVDDFLSKNRTRGVDLTRFEFLATDISGRVLDIAKKGRYDAISIKRGLNDYYKGKYFTKNGSVWDIDPKIRDAVKFMHFNLQNQYTSFGMFDIIFCRYVLIYFSNDQKKEIINKMYGALKEKGALFTGNYALYEMFSDDFITNHYDNLTYYIKKAVTR